MSGAAGGRLVGRLRLLLSGISQLSECEGLSSEHSADEHDRGGASTPPPSLKGKKGKRSKLGADLWTAADSQHILRASRKQSVDNVNVNLRSSIPLEIGTYTSASALRSLVCIEVYREVL